MGKFNAANMFDRTAQGFPAILVQKNTSNPYYGRVAVVSDTLGPSAVVSTNIVNSNSLIFFNVQNQWASGSNQPALTFAVSTISPGGFFKVTAATSTTNVGSYTLMYEIKNPA